MEIITGYTGENHVTSMDDASLYRGIFGQGDYVLDVGNKFAATIIDNNTVRIMDGDLVIQGHQARIRANDYEEVTIDNGTPGEKRNDLIVARYQKNTTTGIESITLEVVKGTPGETAVDPDIVQEDLSTGGTQRDFVLYRVSLNGLAIESVTSLFTVIPNLKDFMTHQADDVTDEGGVHGLEVEVGTFTPILSTTNSDGNATYSGTRNGNYVRIGNLVHVNIRFDVASFTGGTGYYAIRGIPFPSIPPGLSRYNYLLAAHNLPGASHAWYTLGSVIVPASSSGAGAVPVQGFTDTKYIHVSGVYQIA